MREYYFSFYNTPVVPEKLNRLMGTKQNYLVNMLDELAWKSSLMVRVKTKQRERKTKTVSVLAVRNT